jgi:hypothetical protein
LTFFPSAVFGVDGRVLQPEIKTTNTNTDTIFLTAAIAMLLI